MNEISRKTGLSYTKVYKWNWDRKNFDEKIYLKKIFNKK